MIVNGKQIDSARIFEGSSPEPCVPCNASRVECPHWQRVSASGQCIDKWWAGPPWSWMGAALGWTVAGVAAGYVIHRLRVSEEVEP